MRLHDYQQRAVKFLHETPRAGLWLDMGLGKTAITLCALTDDHLPALVVAPKRPAVHTWPAEHARWRPDLAFSAATGLPSSRASALTAGADVTVIGRDVVSEAARGPWRTLIWDESSGLKDQRSLRFKAAARIAKRAEHVWELTGTPVPNGLGDLWAQVFLLDGGQRLGPTLGTFRSRFFRPGRQLANGTVVEWLLREGAQQRIHDLLSDICLSMEGALDLPPVTFNTVTVDLPPVVRRVYDMFRATLVADLELLGGQVHSAANAAVLTGRLSQLTAGFLYSDLPDPGVWDVLHDEKVNALREITDGTGSPVLVFYRFKAEVAMIRKALPQAVPIDTPGAIEAWNVGNVPVLLAHPASAGMGLNLQHGGHVIVWMTLPWALEHWLQGNARILRQGQAHPVVIHTIEAAGSIDAVIADRLAGKKFTQDALLDHLRSVG